MENIIYHQVQPENVKTQYKEYDTIDMVLSFENRAIICNSVRIEADLKVFTNGYDDNNLITGAEDCMIDPKIGGHSVISSVVSTFQNIGVVENLTEYPRYVKMITDATKTDDDMLNSNSVCELRSPHKVISQKAIVPKCPAEYGGGGGGAMASIPAGVLTPPDFSIVPHISINKVISGGNRMSYEQSGAIKISITLERNNGVLFGRDVGNNYTYALENVKCCFMSAPDQKPQPLTMMNTLCIKNSLTSAFSNVSSKVPAVCNAVSVSFLRQDQEYTNNYNNVALQQPPNISSVNYLFNDNSNQFVSFEIKDRVELMERGLEGLNSGTSNSCDLTKISSNEAYILGLNWGQYIDLSNQKFNTQINSDISNLEPYIMWSYFHSVVKV